MLEELELSSHVAFAFEAVVERKTGLVLFCGPTGSGKTTLSEALSRKLASSRRALKSEVLPTNPGVELDCTTHILAGDIRDPAAALRACELASQTLVFATLRSGRSAEAIERLVAMEVPPGVVARATPVVVTQQLCRRLCRKCRRPQLASAQAVSLAGLSQSDLSPTSGFVYEPGSCDTCGGGYRGNVPIFEILVTALHWGPDRLNALNMVASFRQDAAIKLTAGFTTLSEISRVIGTC